MPVVERLRKKLTDVRAWTRVGGALTEGAIDWGFEHYVAVTPEASGTFPYVCPLGIEELPPCDNWISGLIIPGLLELIGVAADVEPLEDLGEGGLLAGVSMLLHHTLTRTITWKAKARKKGKTTRQGRWVLVREGERGTPTIPLRTI